VVALIAIFFFRSEISDFMTRVRKARVFGQEVELDRDLDNLAKSAEKLEEGVTYKANPSTDESAGAAEAAVSDVERDILEETARSPKVGLILLAGEIEREARHLAAVLRVSSHDRRRRSGPMAYSLMRNIQVLTEMGVLPSGIFESLEQFRGVRNEIVHGGRRVGDDDILRAIDSGLSILRVLKAVPRLKHLICASGLSVYSDPDAQDERTDIKAIIVESVDPGGVTGTTRVLPSNDSGLLPGDLVTFEFDAEQSWGPTWYRDQDSGEPEGAWEHAAEFVGIKIDSSDP
jgi:hypothetical protein